MNWRVLKVLGEGLEIITSLLTLKQWIILLLSLGLFVALFVPIIARSF